MVEKMKLLHITGPKYDIDRVMKQYLGKYEIHFENAMSSLGSINNVRPFLETNVYRDVYQNGKELLQYLDRVAGEPLDAFSPKEAQELIQEAYEHTSKIQSQQRELIKRNQELKDFMAELSSFRSLDFEFKKLLDFHFIRFRLGRIPLDYYHKLERYLAEMPHTLFYECDNDEEYVWGVYFVPYTHVVEVDAMYLSFHFEQLYMPDSFEGTPEEAYRAAEQELADNEAKSRELSEQMHDLLVENRRELLGAYQSLEDYCNNFEIRKLAACTRPANKGEYYILYGWMAEPDAAALQRELKDDPDVHCMEETMDVKEATHPPTRLKNPGILKPFEMFVEMYGLPAYNEMDPTLFVALTYSLMFGLMFGDVGQGLFLAVGGFALYHFKKMRLAGILTLAGICSVVFGFLYGSLFGFEEILPALWRRPMDNIMETLYMAIGFGGALILFAMVLNIINAVRAKEYGRLIFDPSGLAGLVCYGFAALCVVLFATGNHMPAIALMLLLFGLPLAAILFKEPLTHLIERRGHVLPEGSKIMFLVEALVELFDVVLSYATNTISFVRVGAFALSHAGMMGVVMTLAGLEQGSPNWLIIILGNLLVTGLEGLVVGIQVLRLEYYEMFSRFYKGSGKPFVAFHKKEN